MLDEQQQLVPLGARANCMLAERALPSYLNRPELNAERFIDNPFATAQDHERGYHRLYRSGDLVRQLADGRLEYFGRNDTQVKIRGYRIELGEIEAALASLATIKQAVVVVLTPADDSTQHGAYYVPVDHSQQLNDSQLHAAMAEQLPALSSQSFCGNCNRAPHH